MVLADRHAGRDPSIMEVLRWLDCGHLPEHLRRVADIITVATDDLLEELDDGQQLVRGLHALVEAKDCFVRQAVLDHECV